MSDTLVCLTDVVHRLYHKSVSIVGIFASGTHPPSERYAALALLTKMPFSIMVCQPSLPIGVPTHSGYESDKATKNTNGSVTPFSLRNEGNQDD